MIGQRVRELREWKNWSQTDLGKKVGCGQRTVSRIELGQSEAGEQLIVKLCHVFQVSADYLLGLEDETGAKTYR